MSHQSTTPKTKGQVQREYLFSMSLQNNGLWMWACDEESFEKNQVWTLQRVWHAIVKGCEEEVEQMMLDSKMFEPVQNKKCWTEWWTQVRQDTHTIDEWIFIQDSKGKMAWQMCHGPDRRLYAWHCWTTANKYSDAEEVLQVIENEYPSFKEALIPVPKHA